MTGKQRPTIDDFPLVAKDKIRYRDTDRQGHVNNAVFSSLLETGRVELLYDSTEALANDGCSFVIVSLKVEFFNEIRWPGEVIIGTRVARVGVSSFTFEQALFQNDIPVAQSESVIVQTDDATRKSTRLSDAAVERLSALAGAGGLVT